MIRFSFPVVSHGKRGKVEVRVFDTHEAMIRSIRRYHRQFANVKEDGWYEDATAITSTFARMKPPRGRWQHHAVIRLIDGYCEAHVIAHEACHAALYFYQTQVQKTIPDLEREEILCHLVSEITEEIILELDAVNE